jgi:hypothetical protein
LAGVAGGRIFARRLVARVVHGLRLRIRVGVCVGSRRDGRRIGRAGVVHRRLVDGGVVGAGEFAQSFDRGAAYDQARAAGGGPRDE